MKVLLLNQTFYPDVASSGQHLADLAAGLAAQGHEVSVIAARRAYDRPKMLFPLRETWRGVHIVRVASTGFGKGTKWGRLLDCASFIALSVLKLPWFDRPDVVMALTSPPLISVVGCAFARLYGSRFLYWVMDLNPDEAIAAGWLCHESLVTRLLEWVSRLSLRCADRVIALDQAMRERIARKGIAREKISVLSPWSHDPEVKFDAEGRERFRRAHGLQQQFVVMYSGNHSPCHPLATVLGAARVLAGERQITFCFIGGGTELGNIHSEFPANENGGTRSNVLCLPYQPLDELSASLSAADLHLVVMGEEMVGIVHPCKVYNLLQVGSPIVYVGPVSSPISDIVAQTPGSTCLAHGNVEGLVRHILKVRQSSSSRQPRGPFALAQRFAKPTVLPQLLRMVEAPF